LLLATKNVISFLRGPLINHDTPLTLCLSGRTLFAPECAVAQEVSLFYSAWLLGERQENCQKCPSGGLERVGRICGISLGFAGTALALVPAYKPAEGEEGRNGRFWGLQRR